MKTTGYFQPMPETQALWDALAQAKKTGDRDAMGKLSGQIQRASVEELRRRKLEGSHAGIQSLCESLPR